MKGMKSRYKMERMIMSSTSAFALSPSYTMAFSFCDRKIGNISIQIYNPSKKNRATARLPRNCYRSVTQNSNLANTQRFIDTGKGKKIFTLHLTIA